MELAEKFTSKHCKAKVRRQWNRVVHGARQAIILETQAWSGGGCMLVRRSQPCAHIIAGMGQEC